MTKVFELRVTQDKNMYVLMLKKTSRDRDRNEISTKSAGTIKINKFMLLWYATMTLFSRLYV